MTTRSFTVPATTNGSGAATVYSPYFSGYVESIKYVKDDFADGVDFACTLEATGENVWTEADVNASETVVPRGPTHSVAGVASLYAAGGRAVMDRIAAGRDRLKIAITDGGDTTSGSFIVTVSG